ncbi:MAG: IclR family transcriptional regulator [Prosthecobacter sp.]|nr:IclR family transcriptional regulator [Prosthecobacter sp.]
MASTSTSVKIARRRAKPGVQDSGFSTPSLDRALAVLERLGQHPGGLTVSELAEELGQSVNFVYRVTQSLSAHGYAHRDGNKRFRIGAKMLSLCQPIHDDVPLVEAALPAMRWLSEQTGEAAHVGILTGAEGLVLERVIGTQMVKFYIERGARFPLHTSAPGKVILALMDEAAREDLMRRMDFKAYQPWTIADRAEFRKHLAQVRQQGWAADLGEHLEGHHCLGAPILKSDHEPVASLWITGPSQRLTKERIVKLAPIVKKAGRMASEALTP